MAFIDTRLNDRYRYGFVGGPAWNTLDVRMASGRSRRKKLWSMPHHRYTANYATLNEAEKNDLLHAFMVSGGAFSAFRFKDWNDHTALNELIGVGDGTSTPMQLVKTYTFGPATFIRPITLPLGAVVRDSDGNTLTVTVNPLTGVVTPSSPWPNLKSIFWTGQFDVRVKFKDDFNPFTSAASNVRECVVELEEDLA